jgi:hypothetical protein
MVRVDSVVEDPVGEQMGSHMGSFSGSAAMDPDVDLNIVIAPCYGGVDVCSTAHFMRFVVISSLGAQPQGVVVGRGHALLLAYQVCWHQITGCHMRASLAADPSGDSASF